MNLKAKLIFKKYYLDASKEYVFHMVKNDNPLNLNTFLGQCQPFEKHKKNPVILL